MRPVYRYRTGRMTVTTDNSNNGALTLFNFSGYLERNYVHNGATENARNENAAPM